VALQPPPLTAVPLVELSLLLENMSHHQSEMEPKLETQCQIAVQEVIKFFNDFVDKDFDTYCGQ
jgi:hypothetical protein